MVPPKSRQIQIRPSPNQPAVRRCRAPHDPDPRHQSWNPLSSRGPISRESPRRYRSDQSPEFLQPTRDGKAALEQVARIDVHEDRLAIRLKSAHDEETADAADGHLLSIPWQKPPSRKSRQILIPDGIPKSEIRPTRIERRARLVSAIARGRRWLDEIVSGSVTDVQQIASRQKCSVRQVNMTISLAFLAPDLVRAAVEGRLPRGIGVERLRDAPPEWSRQFEVLGLNPQ